MPRQAQQRLLGVVPVAFLHAELGEGLQRFLVIGLGVERGGERGLGAGVLTDLGQDAAARDLEGHARVGIGRGLDAAREQLGELVAFAARDVERLEAAARLLPG